ncbi:MAG: glutathione S-transferase N-terminal domain-containing protein [Gammaproteobacteria bacterium]|nr:glutathione S-transferase N-terminal domain-containing protein [Gammaproteobacteria bacterium]MDH5613944.1 glutathione S-transferase N-terminal domain-containing protein [Gammaproteobacteria bacterium]
MGALIANRRSAMTLFSGDTCIYSHRTRIVLAEKGISYDTQIIDLDNKPEDLFDLNPYGTVPTLVDRDLSIYNSRIIMEYLDERFPHPPLMPVEPVARARTRLMLHRIDRDWYSELEVLVHNKDKKAVDKARKTLKDGLTAITAVFEQKPFFMSDEITLLDCAIAALLWRLPHLKVELPPSAKAINKYAESMFARESFKASLTEAERELHS